MEGSGVNNMSWSGFGQPRTITIRGVPSLYCDICHKELMGQVPDGSRIVGHRKMGRDGRGEGISN